MESRIDAMTEKPIIVWLDRDLRLSANPALHEAARDSCVLPVYIWDPAMEGDWLPGEAWQWWQGQSLRALEKSLHQRHCPLVIRRGDAQKVLKKLIDETGAGALYFNRRYEPTAASRQKKITNALEKRDIEVRSFSGFLLIEPWKIETKSGGPYKVFTPYYRACGDILRDLPEPFSTPETLSHYPGDIDTGSIDDLPFPAEWPWSDHMHDWWTPGEEGAMARLESFLENVLASYDKNRDRPDLDGVSCMSPYLAHGDISPLQIYHAARNHMDRLGGTRLLESGEAYLRQLVWREFAWHLLHHFPKTPDQPLYEKFAKFPWKQDVEVLRRWQEGRTGFPIIDAGMIQLRKSGWMHNRVRMLVASFLTKDLLIPWQEGARWFWDCLVDADLGNNTLGWQWTAGCGADAAPYFRIFNPMTQAKKFDPDEAYVKRWLADAEDTSEPLIDHAEARERALAAYETIKGD